MGGWGDRGGQLLKNTEGLERKSVVKEYLIGGGLALGKFAWGGLVAYNVRLPDGLEPPAVLHRGAEGGGGVESAQVGEKAHKKHLVHRGIGFGLETIAARSRDGYRR